MNPLLTIAIQAAREAGDFVMTQYGNTASTQKSDMSPVTEADIGSHTRLIESLQHTEIPILSEEAEGISFPYRDGTPFAATAQGLANVSHTFSPYPDTLWIIDPIDGTRDFIDGTDDFSVMIGLLQNGRPTLGVVYAPVSNTLYYAEHGKGAFMEKNGSTIRLEVSDRTLPNLHLIRSKNHYTPFMERVAEKLSITKATPHGSVGVKAGLLGTQEGDFFLYAGALGVWDICGPEVIVCEAGGKVTDAKGNLISYTEENHRLSHGIVFSNGVCHTEILDAIASSI